MPVDVSKQLRAQAGNTAAVGYRSKGGCIVVLQRMAPTGVITESKTINRLSHDDLAVLADIINQLQREEAQRNASKIVRMRLRFPCCGDDPVEVDDEGMPICEPCARELEWRQGIAQQDRERLEAAHAICEGCERADATLIDHDQDLVLTAKALGIYGCACAWE